MLKGMRNSSKQGDVGVGAAIGWFVKCGYTVCIPLTDTQEYDLVIDIEGSLKKVQVKTTYYRQSNGMYQVNIKQCNRGVVKNYDKNLVDFLFVMLDDGRMFFIPSADVGSLSTLTLSGKYLRFEVS